MKRISIVQELLPPPAFEKKTRKIRKEFLKMNMTKADLLQQISLIDSNCFEVMFEVTEPPNAFDLPEIRTGMIYPPIPHKIRKHFNPTQIRFTIKTELSTNAGLRRVAFGPPLSNRIESGSSLISS